MKYIINTFLRQMTGSFKASGGLLNEHTYVPSDLYVFKIKWLQKIKIYKTQARFFVIGSNEEETKFRILKIDRTDPWELIILDDGVDYNANQISDILDRLHHGNNVNIMTKAQKKGFQPSYIAFGIIGFVRFVEGYYMLVISVKSKAAEIGGHSIYKIEDTSMIYIPNNSVRIPHQDESRYLKTFQTVDLSSHFYFSYSYNLTNTLQNNLLSLSHCKEKNNDVVYHYSSSENENGDDVSTPESWVHAGKFGAASKKAINSRSCKRFVWNNHLLRGLQNVSSLWCLEVIHGHVGQICVNVYGKAIYITLIGRRSSLYAGTRFIKRGCNINGDVANEVETEQIVHCAMTSSIHHTSFTSYVQHRGSIPIHWEQDMSASVVPAKPPITISMDNPYAQATGKHFKKMMKRFGGPVIVLNLVRKRERRFRESILGQEYKLSVDYLNQFLPAKHQIVYHAIDMAHLSRLKKLDVLKRLANIAEHSLQKTGIFFSKPDLFKTTLNDPRWMQLGGETLAGYKVQTGVLRTNCVDCLDRTNSAQFVAGKCALTYQLYSLGVLDQPELEFDTDIMRLYEELFEGHGDIIALQYGGSQLVHTIQSYRRTVGPWITHSRDIVTTLSRYYTNTFSDADKQNAINLFLGVFKPDVNNDSLWDLTTDHYLHNDDASVLASLSKSNLTCWLESKLLQTLPLAIETTESIIDVDDELECHRSAHTSDLNHCDDCVDWYRDLHRPDVFTSFDDLFSIRITNTLSRCLSAGYHDLSPFTTRSENWQQLKHETVQPDSTTSQNDGTSNDSSESDDSDVAKYDTMHISENKEHNCTFPWMREPTLDDFSTETLYGISNEPPASSDIEQYEKYISGEGLNNTYSSSEEDGKLITILPLSIDEQSMQIYKDNENHNYHVDKQFYVDYVAQYKQC